jgi:hypothetical protein
MNEVEQYLQELVGKVCGDLADMYVAREHPSTYGLIFPRKRDGSLRISEQEAKLLFIQQLTVDRRYCFCVETPTTETYIQSGTTPVSARVDVTLIGADRKPIAHIEQKAHNCTLESIRKDLEKLLREKRTGCWFHTLEAADRGTIPALMAKFNHAFSLLPECLCPSHCSYLFAFFVLDTARLTHQWLHFTGDRHHNELAVKTAFGEPSTNAGWQVSYFRTGVADEARRAPADFPILGVGKGKRQAFLVLAPALVPDTFLHLSVRGGRYRIRKYNLEEFSVRPEAFQIKGCTTFEALRESGLITTFVPVTPEDLTHNIDEEPQYWCERIRRINSEHLPAKGRDPSFPFTVASVPN